MKLVKSLLLYLAVGAIAVFATFPFYWAIVTSLKTGSDLFKVEWIPAAPSLVNYVGVLSEGSFLQSILNSVIVAGATTVIALLISILSSYSLARIRFRGRSLVLLTILSVSMFPQIAVLSGMFELIRWLG